MRSFGKYLILISTLFIRRERFSVYTKLIVEECIQVGYNSIFIVVIVSSFIGAVTAVQTGYNLVSDLIPVKVIGTIVRDMTILELAPTIISIVLAGKVGSNIAGHLGTMRITEQIDALEVMGINSSSYLILPKIVACMIMFPMLVVMSGFLSIYGGFLAGTLTGALTEQEYISGIREGFQEYNIWFALIKSIVFAFIISSISAFNGFFTKGGALEVGQSSTTAVTNSCIAVLVADFLLAKLLL
ncbi:MAG TPA: ABC transporter permease [Cytophagaceae bacterium]|nr:ABC transporter permease [Cytophagaceae bacterium]